MPYSANKFFVLQNYFSTNFQFLDVMPTPSKVYRRRLRRLKSPSRSSKSKSRERRQRSVSPSRSRWRDDIRKMKSWRESKKGISMEKKCHKSLGSSLGKTKRVQLKKKIRKRTNSKTDEFILPNIHGSEIKTQTIEEERILKLIPPEEPYQSANIEEVNIWHLPLLVFQWSNFFFSDLGRLFKRTIDKKNLFIRNTDGDLHHQTSGVRKRKASADSAKRVFNGKMNIDGRKNIVEKLTIYHELQFPQDLRIKLLFCEHVNKSYSLLIYWEADE